MKKKEELEAMKKVQEQINNARVHKEQRFYFSESLRTLDAWTGGNYYKYVWELELFGFKICLWRKPDQH